MTTRLAPDEVLDRARQVSREVATPRAALVDDEGVWPAASVRALLDAGLGGLVVPVADGGHGMGLRGLAEVGETVGAARAAHVMAPTTDTLRLWAGRALLDRPLLGE